MAFIKLNNIFLGRTEVGNYVQIIASKLPNTIYNVNV